MSKSIRLVLAMLLVLGALLLGSVAAVAAQEECAIEVEPKEGPTGTQFVLRGSGYTPDRLTLQRGSDDPVSFELELGDADPFEIPIASKPGDEGRWRATVVVSDTECEAQATFRVTLQPTDTLNELANRPSRGVPPVAYVLVIVAGFAAGTLAARHVRVRA